MGIPTDISPLRETLSGHYLLHHFNYNSSVVTITMVVATGMNFLNFLASGHVVLRFL